jgi:excisionase family DNA binding protein
MYSYEGLDRLTVAEAAERLGVKEQAIRKRIQRGTLQHDKDETGRVYVYIDAEAGDEVQDMDTRGDTHLEALVESLQDQVEYLRAELARRGETHLEESQRKDSIIAALTQRIPELEAPASPESSESPTEAAGGADQVEARPAGGDAQEGTEQTRPQERSWWRKMFGG